jgi:glutathione synthase/RimK-type ligase-like ATP-grasp enzyme
MQRETQAAAGRETPGVGRSGSDECIGLARLTRMSAGGVDLRPLWQQLIGKLIEGTIKAGEGLDLSLIAQLLGDKHAGIAIQREILLSQRSFRSSCVNGNPSLRVLALAAATDIGSNTPIEFLLQNSDIELTTLYIVPEFELPERLPDHDIAIVIASDSADCRDALRKIGDTMSKWPCPLLNPPHLVCNLDRDKLHNLLCGIEGLMIPQTVALMRSQLFELSRSAIATLSDIAAEFSFPLIVRPRGSHAGKGLAKIDDPSALARYLGERSEAEFFVSRFVDYASSDGLFRKYRIVMIDGRPYACHLAIAQRWDIWYINAEMSASSSKRLEEQTFMRTFDAGFAARHRAAISGLAERVGLDYFTVDCAESRDGSLLIFEADNTAIVHDMDPPDIFPYKIPQMRKVFDAFAAMLHRRAVQSRERAA